MVSDKTGMLDPMEGLSWASRARCQLPSLRSVSATTLYVNVSIVVFGFVTSVMASRWLGPAGRGELAAALAVSTLLPYIASMGFVSSVLYHSAPHHEGANRTLSSALPLGVIQAAIFGAAAWLLLPVFMRQQSPGVVISAQVSLAALPANLLALYLLGALQGHLRFAAFNVLRLVLPFGSFLGLAGLKLSDHLTARLMVVVYVVLPFVLLFAAASYMIAQDMIKSVRPQALVVKRLFAYGFRAQAGDLANSLNVRLDQVLIAAWLPVEQLGFYVAALGAGSVVGMFGYTIQLVLQPRLLNESTEVGRARLLKQGIFRYLMAGGAVSVAMIGLLPSAVPRIFGRAFDESVFTSQLLVIAAFILGLKGILAGTAHAYGAPWLASKAELAGLVVTFITLAIFVPSLGIEGGALSSILAYAVQAGIIGIGLRRRRADFSSDLEFVGAGGG